MNNYPPDVNLYEIGVEIDPNYDEKKDLIVEPETVEEFREMLDEYRENLNNVFKPIN